MELKGRQQIMKGFKEQGWHLSETDKSKKHSVDNPVSYRENIEKYIKDDKVVDEKFIKSLTKHFNDVNKGLLAILGIGRENLQENRAEKNVVYPEK